MHGLRRSRVRRVGQGIRYFFPDGADRQVFETVRDGETSVELAYAITVHKSQGSDFGHVFLVLPARVGLLSKELVYTALTRSRGRVTLFIQDNGERSPLQMARERSDLQRRNTSLFVEAVEADDLYWPEPGVNVKSKVEYIIHRALRQAHDDGRLEFLGYEQKLLMKKSGVTLKPDFSVRVGGNVYYWEHLGKLDCRDYSSDWEARRRLYEQEGLVDRLVTTDDLDGIREETIQTVIEVLAQQSLPSSSSDSPSRHHIRLSVA